MFPQEKWRSIVKGTVLSTFSVNPSKADRMKIDVLHWPLELNDLVLVIISYTYHALTEFL